MGRPSTGPLKAKEELTAVLKPSKLPGYLGARSGYTCANNLAPGSEAHAFAFNISIFPSLTISCQHKGLGIYVQDRKHF